MREPEHKPGHDLLWNGKREKTENDFLLFAKPDEEQRLDEIPAEDRFAIYEDEQRHQSQKDDTGNEDSSSRYGVLRETFQCEHGTKNENHRLREPKRERQRKH